MLRRKLQSYFNYDAKITSDHANIVELLYLLNIPTFNKIVIPGKNSINITKYLFGNLDCLLFI